MARQSAPALSTSETHVFEDDVDPAKIKSAGLLSEEQLWFTYEIRRTLVEIKRAQYKRIALQFPDDMICHAPRVCNALSQGSRELSLSPKDADKPSDIDAVEGQMYGISITNDTSKPTFYILGDTSYGACCVDEIAAEHVNADVVVHYGRACLSPTTRLRVLHIFTVQPLPDMESIGQEAERTFDERSDKIILMADLPYQYYLHSIFHMLQSRGFHNLYESEVKHDPSSLLPNRTVPDEVSREPCRLKDWQLLYIADPPDALLLTLSSRVSSIHICPIILMSDAGLEKPASLSTSRALNRRYALLTSVKTASTFGILINTLSVQNYLDMVDHVKGQILAAGKKSYQFVVGKVNAAKVANFSEIDAWVVIGCWESSLIESKDFWKPIITPFELSLSLQEDQHRLWTGEWSSDYQRILKIEDMAGPRGEEDFGAGLAENKADESSVKGDDSEPESSPPEFDLRSGKYVSGSRPMQSQLQHFQKSIASNALAKRPESKMAIIGQPSPGADFLQNKRGWKGLGSEFDLSTEEPSTSIAEGRSGLARAYANDRGH